MSSPVPAFLFATTITGSLAVLASTLFLLSRSLARSGRPVHERRQALWTAAALLAAFFVAALLPSRAGFYHAAPSGKPTIQFGVFLPIILGVLLFRFVSPIRRVIEEIPNPWLIGLQLYRVLGVDFLILYTQGHLPGVFALPAGIGDVIVGLLAPFVALALLRNTPNARSLAISWNILGLTDLVIALTTGMLTSLPALYPHGAPNQLASQFPLVMIPVFLVPLAILLHLASLRKLRHPQPSLQASHPNLVSQRS